MSEIPMPELLSTVPEPSAEPQADATDGEKQQHLERALAREKRAHDATTEYARTLWQQLDHLADYLRTDLASGEIDASPERSAHWQEVYAGVLNDLAGPRGDSGYGITQAKLVAQTLTAEGAH